MEDNRIHSRKLSNLFKAPAERFHKPYPCRKCARRFINVHQLTFHLNWHSKKEQPYNCKTCGKQFSFHHSLKFHMKIHSDWILAPRDFTFKQKDYMCVKCGKQFSEQSKLESHVRVHPNIMAYPCFICGRRFVSEKTLKFHEVNHSRSLIACAICGIAFTKHSKLRSHIRIHTGQRDFTCKLCCRRFVQKSQLKNHLDAHNRKPTEKDKAEQFRVKQSLLICEKCGKGFADFSRLALHKRSHSATVLKLEKVGIGTFSAQSLSPSSSSSDRSSFSQTSPCNTDKPDFSKWDDFLRFAGLGSNAVLQGKDSTSESIDNPVNAQEEVHHEVKDLQGQNHIATHPKPILSPYQCPECGKLFVNAQGLTVHVRVHENVMPFICTICKKGFRYVNSLRMHLRIHNGEKPCVCHFCEKRFRHPSNLLQHIRIHTGDKRYKCLQCGKLFIQRSQLKAHLKTHDTAKPFSCDKCGKKLKCIAGLKLHLKKHKQNAQEEVTSHFSPTVENQSFALNLQSFSPGARALEELSILSTSTGKVESESEKNSRQREISETVRGEDVALRRFAKVLQTKQNIKVRNHECIECGRAFAKSESLKAHMLKHATKKVHSCSECGRNFSQLGSLKMHLRTHTGEKPCVCSHCHKAFRSPGNLQQHLRIHTGEKPYPCQECGRRFTQKSQLKTHMKTHTGEKPYECKICGKRLGYVISLKAHMRTHYDKNGVFNEGDCSLQHALAISMTKVTAPAEKNEIKVPFQCSYCSKTFRQRKYLKDHLRTHTGEKPFPCEECGKRFVQKSQMKTHMKTHTGEKPYECEKCGKRFGYYVSLKSHSKVHDEETKNPSARISDKHPNSSQNSTVEVMSGTHIPTSTDNLQKQSEKSSPENETSDMENQSKKSQEYEQLSQSSSGRRKQSRPRKLKDEQDVAVSGSTETAGDPPKYSSNMKTYRKIQNGIKIYACPTCERSFTQSGNLMLHLRTHTGEKPHPCSYCPKRFRNPSNLQQHIRTHTGEKPHPCEECGRRFAQKSQLKTHMKTHTREKPFVCGTCGKCFGYAISLRTHAKCHENAENAISTSKVSPNKESTSSDKKVGADPVAMSKMLEEPPNGPPFTCKECQKNFINLNSLKLHVRIHTGEKPCACQYCGKGFAHPSNLISHVRIHTGEKPFGCEICDKRFVQSSQLRTHMKVHKRCSSDKVET